MVNVTQAFTLASQANAANRDFWSRVIILLFIILFNIFVYFYSKNFSQEKDWQKLRNFFFKIVSCVVLIMFLFFSPFILSEGASLDTLIEFILYFYSIAMVVGVLCGYFFFYELVKDLFVYAFNKLSLRRNYLFKKRRS
jgi:hypothetical protein